ncbi:MAG: hypothetical protein LBD76_07345 [Prevotellaceae bacterium]|jgi:hypothetical protein|nr:hypothetical protein [Prevotellaceae bacterium]
MIDLSKTAKNVDAAATSQINKVMPDASAVKIPETVSFKSVHGKFLSAQTDGKAEWNSDTNGEKEKIQLVEAEQGMYGVKSVHGKFLSAQPDGRVEWNRDKLDIWEKWTVENKGNAVALKSYHGKYLSAQSDGRVEANRAEAKQWESFEVI